MTLRSLEAPATTLAGVRRPRRLLTSARWDLLPPHVGMVLHAESAAAGDRQTSAPEWFYLRYGVEGGADEVIYRCSRRHAPANTPIHMGSWLLVTRAEHDTGVIVISELWQVGTMLEHELTLHGVILPCYSP